MVKLKVYVRVIPESAYGADAAAAASRKFLVVVHDPSEWFVGTLAHEAQRTYQRLYKHELGRVKYLKDGDDNDLDPEQLVVDIFVNEGKAARDGLDQEAVIKIVQEQGRAVRAGSVVPDLTPLHYARPPVPKFSALPSSLGKRTHSAVSESPRAAAEKRSKLAEILESQEIVPSVERSPELIQDTQRELEEDDVFDDAQESHDTTKANGISLTSGGRHPPITPSNHGLVNGATVLTSPAPQTSSATSKFKSSGRGDAYAYPESDIEDSQMSGALPKPLANGVKGMEVLEPSSLPADRLPDEVEAFNAHEALQPMDIDEAILADDPASLKSPYSAKQKVNVASSPQDTSSSESSDDGEELAQLKVAKSRQPPTSPSNKSKPGAGPKQQHTNSVLSQSESTPKGQKRKQEQSSNAIGNKLDSKEKQERGAQLPQATQSAAKTKKQKSSGITSDHQQLKPNLAASQSRRTSGVISELDSPGEQLSQSLWDSAKGQHLAEGVKAALAKPMSKQKLTRAEKQAEKRAEKRAEKAASRSVSHSASSSRPSSRDGLSIGDISKAAKEQSQQLKTKSNVTAKEQAKKETPKAGKPPQSKSLQEKLAEAAAKGSAKPAEAAGGSKKQKRGSQPKADSSSDADEGAPLPSIEASKDAQHAASTSKSTLPLPNWGSNEHRSPSINATPALVVPAGMTEEEYIRLRAKAELTPQPPKDAMTKKRKDSAPAVSANTPVATAKELVNKGKETVEKKGEMAKTTAKKTMAAESSSEEEETTSSSEESEDETKGKHDSTTSTTSSSTKSQAKSVSKSKSPVEVRKEAPIEKSASKDKKAMPPPTPKSTAKRRESMNKHRGERSSSSAPTQDSKKSSSKSSASPAPTKAKVDAKSSLQTKPSATPAKPTATAESPKPKPPQERKSGLKELRQKMKAQAASNGASPVPSSMAALSKKKPLPAPSSSSSDSSSDDDSSDESVKKSTGTPLGVIEKKPDPTIRDPSPEDSSDESDDD